MRSASRSTGVHRGDQFDLNGNFIAVPIPRHTHRLVKLWRRQTKFATKDAGGRP
jgi:hypothetical protein